MRIVGIVNLSYRVCLNMVSCLVDRYAQVAQLVEQWTENPRVGGSNPPLGTISLLIVPIVHVSTHCYPDIFGV